VAARTLDRRDEPGVPHQPALVLSPLDGVVRDVVAEGVDHVADSGEAVPVYAGFSGSLSLSLLSMDPNL